MQPVSVCVNPLGAQAANLAGYKSIPMCTPYQIGCLINVKVDLEPKPLHHYNFAVMYMYLKKDRSNRTIITIFISTILKNLV